MVQKGGNLKISDIIFIPNREKQNVTVGFSKKDFKNHKGITGLKYYLIIMYLEITFRNFWTSHSYSQSTFI